MQQYGKLQFKCHSNLIMLLDLKLVWSFRFLKISKNFTFKKNQSFHSFIFVNVQCKVPYEEVQPIYGVHYAVTKTLSLIVVRQKYLVTFFRCDVVIETSLLQISFGWVFSYIFLIIVLRSCALHAWELRYNFTCLCWRLEKLKTLKCSPFNGTLYCLIRDTVLL